MITSIEWKNSSAIMIDQRKLPNEEIFIINNSYEDVAENIENMVIRGAPAIGVAAAMGIALGTLDFKENWPSGKREKEFSKICSRIESTRPTAINLFWAIERMKNIFMKSGDDLNLLKENIVAEALKIRDEDIEINKLIGKNGSLLFGHGCKILTHCNTGGLATAGYGTALGVIRNCYAKYRDIFVYATETRPYLQGARLTAWELKKENIPFRLITDSMAGNLMQRGEVNAVIVGADRIAANGDTANKIGTYTLSVLALYHNIPFYIAAPISTIDFSMSDGSMIPVEKRDEKEVLNFRDLRIAPENVHAENPAFDITPYENISAIITEKGVVERDFEKNIKKLMY